MISSVGTCTRFDLVKGIVAQWGMQPGCTLDSDPAFFSWRGREEQTEPSRMPVIYSK